MSKATELGFSPERLARIDALLRDGYVGPGKLAQAHFVLTRRGETVHEVLLGEGDPKVGEPLKADAVYRIFSMTKPVTCVALMQLVEEGKIALDDPVAKHIPSWAGLGVYASGQYPDFQTTPPKRPMIVADLMRHTSGLTYGFHCRTALDATYRSLNLDHIFEGLDLEGMIEALATVPLEFSPGEAWNYSVSTDVVGYLVQKLAGKPLNEVLQERIFGPLMMVDTGFWARPDQQGRLTACFQALPDGRKLRLDGPDASPFLAPPKMLSGGGGLVSTMADYLRFAQMLLRGGELDGVRILSPKMLELMVANHLPGGGEMASLSVSTISESVHPGVGFGLGMAVVTEPARTLIPCSKGEFYWGGIASTAFWVDPAEEITAVFLTQLMPSSTYPIRRELRTLAYSALMQPNA